MNERRKFLGALSRGAAGLVALMPTFGAMAAVRKMSPKMVESGTKLIGPGRVPEMIVEDSSGRSLRFYNDLIKGKVVLINFMSIDNEKAFPITSKLLEITRQLGPKVGAEVHVVSITSDPAHDTPQRLRAFAARMNVPKRGWHFVRMSMKSSELVTARFHRHPMAPEPHAKIGVIIYGNEPVGLWGVFPMSVSPDDASLRIANILTGKPHHGPARRAGPRKLSAAGMPFNHRIA